jgi:hypothetical protein
MIYVLHIPIYAWAGVYGAYQLPQNALALLQLCRIVGGGGDFLESLGRTREPRKHSVMCFFAALCRRDYDHL